MSQRNTLPGRLWLIALGLCCTIPGQAAEPSVSSTMDQIVSRMQRALGQEELLRLDEQAIQRFIMPEDREVLATQYWHFTVNVPVVVSVMRDVQQRELPAWLTSAGFKKTVLQVANGEFQYEVWQKRFEAGRVGLGINGFAKHRPHYFICLRPALADAALELGGFFPADQQVLEMREGALTYYDWPDLVLTKVPEPLKGQKLLPTYRGRAREAQLIGAFRQTLFPSSGKPDQVVLTWSESPAQSQTVQWRAIGSATVGTVRFKRNADGVTAAWREAQAERQTVEDRFLVNDPAVSHFTATLRGLQPATTYLYSVGGPTEELRRGPIEFTTASANSDRFSFVVLSDTHDSPVCGKLLAKALQRYPDTTFCAITGDLVSVGQDRDDWDRFFDATRVFAGSRSLVPVVGNHDTLDGLGAHLYLSLFGLPTNGPPRLEPERSYSFQYGNALFVVLDATSSIEDQAPWLEEQLDHTKATWKFVLFHFPPYAPDDNNPDIVRAWCPLFDKYHVDFVLSGHVHHSLRTYPLNHGQPVTSTDQGTIYLLTVAVPNRPLRTPKPAYAAALDLSGLPLYQAFEINGKRLVTRSCDAEGKVHDKLVIEKGIAKRD